MCCAFRTKMAAGMKLIFAALACFGVVQGLPRIVTDVPPKWGDVYSVQGILSLPYAEIEEPFTGYYDASNKRSRIDYYGGMVMTVQRADKGQFGTGFKVAPVSTYQVKNLMSCFRMPGISEAPVEIQSILPDLTMFKKQPQQEVLHGQICDVWKMVDTEENKVNTYTMWVAADRQLPVRYEMKGFDSLLGSHFDKYLLDYEQYDTAPIPESVFETPANITCGDFPGPGDAVHRILNNPMREYMNNHDSHVTEMFDQFKGKYKPVYAHEKVHAQRLHNFRQNLRYIHSKNRQGLTYRLAVNHLADWSASEMKLKNGYRHTPGDHGAKVFDKSTVNVNAIPESLNWRLLGAVTQVKDQGVCGSCWSFGTVGTIEGAYFMKHGKRIRFSQQQLVDCAWGEGNNGCDGGEDFRSYKYIMKAGGLASEEDYGKYLAQDGYCHDAKYTVKLSSYTNVTAYDQEALTFAIATKGPVSVGIDASHKSLSFYADGVYYEPACGSKPDQLDHAVLAIGYGEQNGQKYWLIKNSWSTYWGDDGYVLMSQKNNNCGVATSPTFVDIE